jgi:hypothetical protein
MTQLAIRIRKAVLRRKYLQLQREYDRFSCGHALAEEIRPDLAMLREEIERGVAELRAAEGK